MKTSLKWVLSLGAFLAVAAATVALLNIRDEGLSQSSANSPVSTLPQDQLVERGAYLAKAGNCVACHTQRGGAAYAGGLGVVTPFGTVFASNLTPDPDNGLGTWSANDFWRAMHNGRSKSGRLLYPAFPYTSYTQVTRQDSDALFAFLRSLPPVAQAAPAHDLQFPFQSQAALAVWRALYFSPGVFQPDNSRSAEWNRGAYLVQGLGHCSACHSPRDALGGIGKGLDLAGGQIPMQNWYAPSLTSPHEASVASWDKAQIVSLLKTGVADNAGVSGPMGEVVLRSTQYLRDDDLNAMAQYLKELPTHESETPDPATQPAAYRPGPAQTAAAAKLYEQNCAQCHGDQGQGVPKAYPALAGNRAVTMAATENVIQMVLRGGFAPATEGNPRPYGMPPFMLTLSDEEVAAVVTHIRTSWDAQASPVSALQVQRVRGNP